MGTWADQAIATLRSGAHAVIHPRGGSMTPIIRSGDRVDVEPVTDDMTLKVGDIVLVSMSVRTVYLHKITAAQGQHRFQISNNRGRVNGWATRASIHGRAVSWGRPGAV